MSQGSRGRSKAVCFAGLTAAAPLKRQRCASISHQADLRSAHIRACQTSVLARGIFRPQRFLAGLGEENMQAFRLQQLLVPLAVHILERTPEVRPGVRDDGLALEELPGTSETVAGSLGEAPEEVVVGMVGREVDDDVCWSRDARVGRGGRGSGRRMHDGLRGDDGGSVPSTLRAAALDGWPTTAAWRLMRRLRCCQFGRWMSLLRRERNRLAKTSVDERSACQVSRVAGIYGRALEIGMWKQGRFLSGVRLLRKVHLLSA